ncbi:hypothetical protein [Devosia sp. 2618]|uniref:hypothetical protein n=1 Tax=Devosia sp. 2618 TaxID=3156454 RepID=UPI0033954F4F
MALNAAFFDAVRTSLFDGKLNQAQVEGLNAIASAWDRYGDGQTHKLAYLMATAHHETGQLQWLKEIWRPTRAQRRYERDFDKPWTKDDPRNSLAFRLGNTQAGDGKRFMGRGLAHITGRRNYTDWAKRLGVDIVGKPELAEQLPIAARILVEGSMLGTFTGKKLGDYITSTAVDWKNARRVINGTDKADLIAGYAEQYQAALKAGLAGEPAPKPKPIPVTPLPESAKGKSPPWGIITIILFGLAVAGLFFVRF